jgi:hypothetical protein
MGFHTFSIYAYTYTLVAWPHGSPWRVKRAFLPPGTEQLLLRILRGLFCDLPAQMV